jgi:hypothetical protein
MKTGSDLQAPIALRKAQKMANMLDSAIGIPFTKIRFGLDSILGLVPGLGDVVGLALSAHIIRLAGQMDAPKSLRIAMVRNSSYDFLIGLIPVIGDISDIFYKANLKNIRLLESWWVKTHHKQLKVQAAEHLEKWQQTTKSD